MIQTRREFPHSLSYTCGGLHAVYTRGMLPVTIHGWIRARALYVLCLGGAACAVDGQIAVIHCCPYEITYRHAMPCTPCPVFRDGFLANTTNERTQKG
jgi:hypothetical protein